MRSNFLNLNLRDFFKGLVLAVITAVVAFLYEKLLAGVPLDLELLKAVGMTALAAFLAYLLKNLFTNSAGEILTPEPK
jgi:hypothetical protein